MIKKHFWKIVLLVVCALLIGSVLLGKQIATKANEGIVTLSHTKGNTQARVSLLEYSDFQCPACAQFYPEVKTIVETYNTELSFEYRHFPLSTLHQYAIPAAVAAEAAGQQGKFFEMHDKLFENQKVWSQSPTPHVFFAQYAKEIGLDVDLFKRHSRASILKEKVRKEFSEAQSNGLTGTPSFFLNGVKMEFQTFDEFRNQIERALGNETAIPMEEGKLQEVKFGLPSL